MSVTPKRRKINPHVLFSEGNNALGKRVQDELIYEGSRWVRRLCIQENIDLVVLRDTIIMSVKCRLYANTANERWCATIVKQENVFHKSVLSKIVTSSRKCVCGLGHENV